MRIRGEQVKAMTGTPWGPRRRLHDSLVAMGHGAAFDMRTGDLLVRTGEESARVRFDDDGHVSSIEEASGRSFRVGTDAQGRAISLSDGPGRRARLRYDAEGRLSGATDAGGFAQDVVYRDGRPAEIQRQGLRPVRMAWDEGGRLQGLKDGRGASLGLAYDAEGRVTRLTARSGTATSYRYGAGGRLEEVRLPGGAAWRFVESPDGRSAALVRPDGARLERISLGPDEEQLVRADGSRVAVQLDGQGLPKRVTYPEGPVTSFAWGPGGRPVAAEDGVHQVRFEYDGAGRCTAEEADGVRVESRWDEKGRPSGITFPSGEQISYEAGPDGRVETVRDWEGNVYRVEWTPGGQVSSIRFPGALREAATHHPTGQLAFQELWAGDQRFARRYSRDENDLVREVDDSARGIKTLRFDPDDRLLSVSSPLGGGEWSWDGNGNAIRSGGRSLEYDALDRITGGDGIRCRTDAEGNLVEWEDEGGRSGFHYDSPGRLVRLELPGGRIAEYEYDPLGRRIVKRVDGKTTRFLWFGAQLLSESTDGPSPTRTDYLYLPGTGRPLAMRQDGQILFFQVDHLDTPIRLFDRHGHVAWEAEPLGTTIRVLREEVRQPLRFPGQYFDAESGLHYNVTRYYHPRTGRYVSPDPEFLKGQSNRYLYALGNPSEFTDPLGQFPPLIVAAGGAVLLAAGIGVLFAGGHQLVTNAIHGDPWDKNLKNAVRAGAITGAAGGAGAVVGGLIGFAVGGPVGAVVGGIIGGLIGGALGAAALAAYDAPKGQGWAACKEALINSVPFVGSVRRFLDNPNDPQRWPQLLADVSFDILGLALIALGARKAMTEARVRQPVWEAVEAQKKAAAAPKEEPPAPREEKTVVVSRKEILAEQKWKETVEKTGDPSEASTWREGEVPYHNPPEVIVVKRGQPLDLTRLDPNKRYLWVVDPDGNILIAPEKQPGFGANEEYPDGRPVKHGDLTPGPDGQSRGPARAAGELNPIRDGDGNPTGLWEMNNDSSYTFARTDGKKGSADNLNACFSLLEQSGTDTGKIMPNNTSGTGPR